MSYEDVKCEDCDSRYQRRVGPDQDGRFYRVDCNCYGSMLTHKDKEITELKRENKQLHTLLGPNKPFFKES